MTEAEIARPLLTPSKVTAWLDCPHYLTLKHGVERGMVAAPSTTFGEFARLLMDKGLEHEHECLAHFRAEGRTVHTVPDRPDGANFADWVTSVGDVLADGHDVIYQMPFACNGMRGIADFLVKVPLDDGTFTYEPVDAKLARTAAKPGHVLQLCFYADAIQAAGYARPKHVHVWLGSGRIETVRLHEVVAYWRRLQRQLRVAMEPAPDAPPTLPVKCNHCQFCEFAGRCEQEWRDADALQFVAGIRRTEIELLEAASVSTMASLAVRGQDVPDLRPERRERLVSQAALQVLARAMPADAVPPHRPLPDPTPEEAAAGMAALPAPDDGDVFLDYEGHPFWRAGTGLFFLFGLLTKDARGAWTYEARWAHSKAEEGGQAQALIEYFAERRTRFPGMHVYHYNHTERSALESMAAEHGADQTLLQQLIETGLFVDLLGVVRNSLQAGVESYGLKSTERLARYERGHEIDKGAGAVVGYERYTRSNDPGELRAIEAYNADDVRATLALRDWLLTERPAGLEWRPAEFARETTESRAELDALIGRLHARPDESIEHLMGDLLGYWGREGAANTAKLLATVSQDPADLLDDQNAIVGLHGAEAITLLTPKGKVAKHGGMRFRFPPQPTAYGFARDGDFDRSVCYSGGDGMAGWATVVDFDPAGQITLQWNTRSQELGIVPSQLVLNEWISPRAKKVALEDLGRALDLGTAGDTVQTQMLAAAPPRFTDGRGPGLAFTDEVDDVMEWVLHLDRTCVPIQGPPGTGKTWMGAHLALALVKDGRRVGVTAMSHHAIDNFLHELLEVFEHHGSLDRLHVGRVGAKDSTPTHPAIHVVDNEGAADAAFNVVAGTAWAFASKSLRASPVDVLIIDEAGQLGIADALAASCAAGNVVLLGDPLQLPQVAQATHPGRSGLSILEHVLGDDVVTVADDRGVFLTTTRRMHPDVCTFISDEIYEGRLGSHPSCALQSTGRGTGLRWLRAQHADCSTESDEEAELVIGEMRQLIGSQWTDAKGATRTLSAADFMVVAPYNDQVRLMRRRFDADPELAAVKVGTVDKFQGQQAPVVFFTMTSSTDEDMPRGPDFLFSRNRLNVAISRAKCLAYVVCTDELLNTRARDVDEMRLISTLCAAVAYATRTRPSGPLMG